MTFLEQCEVLKPLCRKLRRLSETPQNEQNRRDWAAHNSLSGGTRPLLWICPDDDGGWRELVGDSLVCEDGDLRIMEFQLRKLVFHAENFSDDYVFEPVLRFDLPGHYTGYHYGLSGPQTAWGIHIDGYEVGSNAYHLSTVFDYERDREKFFNSEADFITDTDRLAALKDLYETAADGEVDIQFVVPYIALVQSLFIELVHLRGLEDLMFDLMDNQEALHEVLDHMSASKARLLDKLEREGRLYDNRSNFYTGSGGLGYTGDALLPAGKLSHNWGFADAQELGSVSPAMFEEFALQYQSRGLNKFGMACYGCCEPMDDRMERVFKHIPRLRRVSVSPWSNPAAAAELIGDKAIFSWKPNPATICNGFDRDRLREQLTEVARLTRSCTTEIILKDIRSCGGTPVHLQAFAECVRDIFQA